MKKIFILLFLTSNLFIVAQEKYKKVQKGKCTIDHTCRLEYYYDEFDETSNYKIGFYETNLAKVSYTGNSGTVSYTLDRTINKDKKSIIYMAIFGNATGCRTRDSYVHFIFKNGEKLKINTMSNSIDCGTSVIAIILDKESLNLLMNNEIDKIRLQYSDTTEDFVVSEKGQKKLLGNLKCINSIE
jgi:hypothetical protein